MSTEKTTQAWAPKPFMTQEESQAQALGWEQYVRANHDDYMKASYETDDEQKLIAESKAREDAAAAAYHAAQERYGEAVRAENAALNPEKHLDPWGGLITARSEDPYVLKARSEELREALNRADATFSAERSRHHRVVRLVEAQKVARRNAVNEKQMAARRREKGLPEPEKPSIVSRWLSGRP